MLSGFELYPRWVPLGEDHEIYAPLRSRGRIQVMKRTNKMSLQCCIEECFYEHIQEYKVTARRKKRKTDFEKNAESVFSHSFEHCEVVYLNFLTNEET